MSFRERFAQLLGVLPLLLKTEPNSMVSITVSSEDTISPELFQVIDNYDGTFKIQHLSSDSHKLLYTKVINRDQLLSVLDKIYHGISMELLWGSNFIVSQSL